MAIVVTAAFALSGCGMSTIVTDARNDSIRNMAEQISDMVDCFEKVHITPGEDLDARAKQNELCGDWRTLGATDEEMTVFKFDLWNTPWLMRIDTQTAEPVVTVMALARGTKSVMTATENHDVVVCMQFRLEPAGATPQVTDYECPAQWYLNASNPEVMTIKELQDAASTLGMTVKT